MRVLVAMSGGVDSSMAAALLVDAGHDVTGVHLKMADVPAGPPGRGCCTLDDARDARRVAGALGIPFYVWNLADAFAERVVEPFVAAYGAGTTPNPCIRCNERVKYAALLDRAVAVGFDALATGHHARVRPGPSGPRLLRGADPGKDQSYVLHMATRAQLERTVLPVGVHTKAALRAAAAERGLATAAKPDSHDICFIPSGDLSSFLGPRLGSRPGPIVDERGEEVGRHDGAWRFTVGQRRGLGLAGGTGKRYVTRIAGDVVHVGSLERLRVATLVTAPLHWIAGRPPAADVALTAQVRAHGTPLPVVVDAPADVTTVRFTGTLPEGVAPGQALVVYAGDECLGGATIRSTTPAEPVDLGA